MISQNLFWKNGIAETVALTLLSCLVLKIVVKSLEVKYGNEQKPSSTRNELFFYLNVFTRILEKFRVCLSVYRTHSAEKYYY